MLLASNRAAHHPNHRQFRQLDLARYRRTHSLLRAPQAKALDIENELRGTLHNFGLKVGSVKHAELLAQEPAGDQQRFDDRGQVEPMSLSACPFCHGDRGAIGRSRMPIARTRRIKTSP